MDRLRFIVDGNVQGVRLRQLVISLARDAKLKGHVKNLLDGTVEIICECQANNLKEFERKLTTLKGKQINSYPKLRITNINKYKEEPSNEFKIFGIEYGTMQEELGDQLGAASNILLEFWGDTSRKFGHLDTKYDRISDEMSEIKHVIKGLRSELSKMPDSFAKDFGKVFSQVMLDHEKRLIKGLK